MVKSLERISSTKVFANEMFLYHPALKCRQKEKKTMPAGKKENGKNENCKTKAILKNKIFSRFRARLPQLLPGTEWNMLRETWFIISIRRRQRHFRIGVNSKTFLHQLLHTKRLSFILFLCIKTEFTALEIIIFSSRRRAERGDFAALLKNPKRHYLTMECSFFSFHFFWK